MNSNVDEGMTPEPFLDWSNVWPGATAYEKDGRGWVSEGPEGVRLSVQPGEQSGPVLADDNPDEFMFQSPSRELAPSRSGRAITRR